MPLADRVDAFLKKWKTGIAAACCCLGAVRVLIFAAGFPLFNPVDESSHYEMVYEYSRGSFIATYRFRRCSRSGESFTTPAA